MLTELDNYLERIRDLRGQVRSLVVDLPPEALNWRPIPGDDDHATNSLAVLAAHSAGAEHFWIAEVVGGYPVTRDRAAEFAVAAHDAAELTRILDRVGAETQQVFSTPGLVDLDGARQARDRSVPVRWCILHVIDHTALHLGHMQLTYQLWADGKTKPSPLWFERLRT